MTLAHHREMAPHAVDMVDASRRVQESRSAYDHDYLGHYTSKKERNNHTRRIMNEQKREERLWLRDNDHRRALYGEDEAAQEEARMERIREKRDGWRRMGYARSPEDYVSASLLGILSSCLHLLNVSCRTGEPRAKHAGWYLAEGSEGALFPLPVLCCHRVARFDIE